MVIRTRDVNVESATDAELAERASSGNTASFEELYRRHADAAWRTAIAVAGNAHDASDAVSDAFTRLLQTMAAGRVPAGAPFRPYLLATTRNAAIDIIRRRNRTQPAEADVVDTRPDRAPGVGPADAVVTGFEASVVGDAFRSLPERWRSVLWLIEVEGMPAREVGERLGLSANGASQLAVRARSGLRERYLQGHLASTVTDAECQDVTAQLGAYAAGALSARGIAKVDQHLSSCEACRGRLAELEDVESALRRIVLPLPIGLGALALEHFHLGLAAAHPGASGLLLGGPRMAKLASKASRPLAVASVAVFAVGVISAAVLGGTPLLPGVPSPRQVALAPAPPAGAALASAVPAAPGPPLAAGAAPIAAAGPGAAPAASSSAQVQPATGAHTTTTAGRHPTTTTTTAPSPIAQVDAGVNAGAGAVSVSAGVGPGSCVGVSVAGGKSCAPPAPASPGAAASITTPAGHVGV